MIQRFLISLCLAAVALSAQVAVVNGASFRANQPVAAGSIASAFGNFGTVTNTLAPSLPLPTTLGGVQLTVNNVPAPLFFVSSSQVNFQVPSSLVPGRYDVRVTVGGTTTTGSVIIIDAGPGIFMFDPVQGESTRRGIMLNQDNSLNTSDRRAARGQVVQIFGTGPGALSTNVADGTAAPAAPATTRITPRVLIGGVEAQVQFSGLAPGFVGLWQVNVTIPNQPFITGRMPMQIFMNGVDSQEVSVFVQ